MDSVKNYRECFNIREKLNYCPKNITRCLKKHITIFRIVIVFLDVSKPHPATSQFLKFSIGVRNDPRKGSYKRDENIKISSFLIKRD